MEQFAGALQEALARALSFFYDVVPSYGVAIVMLTLAVRVVLLPLTIKQMRSMHEMGKVQPKVKEIQKKYKGNRQKISEETMKLYKEHRVNPLGGCLPLVLQLPVFFALFTVLRAATIEIAVPADPIAFSEVKDAFCTPVGEPSVLGKAPNALECDKDGDGEFERTIEIGHWEERDGDVLEPRDVLTRCTPVKDERSGDARFQCQTTVGTGHLPGDSDLFGDIVEDRATFLGMHLSCGATQAQAEENIRQCAPPGTPAGGAPLVGYYGLIALMVGSTWYQTKQMQATSGQQQQMQLMGRIMPIFLGFISLTIPAGVLVYWVTTNGWQVGQQYVMIRTRQKAEAEVAAKGRGPAKPRAIEAPPGAPAGPTGDGPPAPRQPQRKGSRARSRKKRRKR